MSRLFSVKFRGGEIDIEVHRDHGYEHDTGAHDVDWDFAGLTAAQVEALGITNEEDDAIMLQIYEVLRDSEGDDYDLDRPS